MLLKQKAGWAKREFELVDNNLRVKYKDGKGTKEWTLPVEEVGHTKYFHSPSKMGNYICGAFFLIFALVTTTGYFLSDDPKEGLIWILVGNGMFVALGAACILLPKQDEIHLTGGQTAVSFFANSPSRAVVEEFIEFVIKRNKEVVLAKYAKVDPDLPEETQMNQLFWLKSREYISEMEYEHLKRDYRTKKLMN